MKKYLFVLFVSFGSVACADARFEACGLQVHDELITPEMACKAVESVRLAYAEWGDNYDVEEALDGISVYRRDIKVVAAGMYRHGSSVQDRIVIDVAVTMKHRILSVLTHEIVHVVQNKVEDISNEEMNAHVCPHYGWKCEGVYSIELMAYLFVVDLPLTTYIVEF